MIVQMVSIHKIVNDDFFRFSSDYNHSQLKKSIQLSGIRNPLLVYSSESGYRLLSGFHRFKVAEELDFKKIPVVLKKKTVSLTDAFFSVLVEHLTLHTLNLVEKARVFNICREMGISEEQILRQFLPILDLPQNQSTIKKLQSILKFSEPLQFYIEKVDLSLKKVVIFKSLSTKEQSLIADLGNKLQIKPFELTEITRLVLEIAIREELSFYDVLKKTMTIDNILSDQLTRKQKLVLIKRKMLERRYPKLTFWNSNLKRMVRRIKLPQSMHLSWDRNLEKPGIILKINLDTLDSLKETIDCFSKKETLKQFKKLLELV